MSNTPIDRDYARMMTELRAMSQVWQPAPRTPRKRSLFARLTHRHH